MECFEAVTTNEFAKMIVENGGRGYETIQYLVKADFQPYLFMAWTNKTEKICQAEPIDDYTRENMVFRQIPTFDPDPAPQYYEDGDWVLYGNEFDREPLFAADECVFKRSDVDAFLNPSAVKKIKLPPMSRAEPPQLTRSETSVLLKYGRRT